MSRSSALDTIEALPGVMVWQHLQLLEEFCPCFERRNRYKVSALPQAMVGNTPRDSDFRKQRTILQARENSTCCCRFWCSSYRELTIGMFPGDQPDLPKWPREEPSLSFYRPFRCTCCWCCCQTCPQEMHVNAQGRYIGKVEQDWRAIDALCCCRAWLTAFDSDNNPVYSIKTPRCGVNCCAPTCCNRVHKTYVYNPHNENRVVAMLKNVFPGFIRGILCSQSADNYMVEFEEGATKEHRALQLAALFLNDFLYFESADDDDS